MVSTTSLMRQELWQISLAVKLWLLKVSGMLPLNLVPFILDCLIVLYKDELTSCDDPTGLINLVAPAIHIDAHLREQRRERSWPARARELPCHLSSSPEPTPSTFMRTTEPMQLGHTHISAAECQLCLQDNCCLYSRQSGHIVSTRPVKEMACH